MGLGLFNFSGRTALVTSWSRRRGNALARGLAEAGATVILNGRDTGKLAAAATELQSGGAQVHELVLAASDPHAVRAAIDNFAAEIGAIDILMNSVGMQHRAPPEEFTAEAFLQWLQTVIARVQTALARPSIAPCTATKGAVANRAKGMASDRARHGLNCNALAPGYFETPVNAALVADPVTSASLARTGGALRCSGTVIACSTWRRSCHEAILDRAGAPFAWLFLREHGDTLGQ